jgi:hypothetical protein
MPIFLLGKTFWASIELPIFFNNIFVWQVTELKCASFLPMDHIVRVLTAHGECIVEAKVAYIQFMLHCYIDWLALCQPCPNIFF